MNDSMLTPERLRDLLKIFKERYGEQYRLRSLGYFGSFAGKLSDPERHFDGDFFRGDFGGIEPT